MIAMLMTTAALAACGTGEPEAEAGAPQGAEAQAASLAYDGADYGDDEAAKIAHGDRLASVLLCRGCHAPELTGTDMGELEPELAGVVASNLTRTVPKLDDEQLERLLREGVHPTRDEFWMMPSKIYQHLSAPDMAALMAYLRTLEPKGQELPLTKLNDGLVGAAGEGHFLEAKAEVAVHAEKTPLDLGERHAQGRYIAMTVCADCHGATLRGEEQFGPDFVDLAVAYDAAAIERLLATGQGVEGRELGLMSFIGANLTSAMTDIERKAVAAYLEAMVAAEADAGSSD
ncbi:c-type cytochrome [Sphingomicrobium arenosum]|uniref:c-type cytochrome n=1 Tax=Sphingomicrobium arenosum TaxID=2233861 RepID=UPI00223FF5FC|nr:c-type cytochrome [Sphingomicrobium arenosum]